MTIETIAIIAILVVPIYILFGFSLYNQSKIFKLYIKAVLSKNLQEFSDTEITEKSLEDQKPEAPANYVPIEGLTDEEFLDSIKG